MDILFIAKACHDVNRAYCQAIGDDSQPSWQETPDWQVRSAINGVKHAIDYPDATPSASHESWLREKTVDGWKYGSVKDPEKKEHPCFLPYDQLPQEQKIKDYLFLAVVQTLKND